MSKKGDSDAFSALVRFSEKLSIPEPLFRALKENEDVLLVATSGFKKVLMFPIQGGSVYRVKLYLDEQGLSPEFFTSLGQRTKEANMNAVYNTGVCTKETVCYWEGFFLVEGGTLDEENVKEKLSGVPNVTGVELERMVRQD
ncbi:MAG: hypothetical protein Kow0069_23250 [Promethearchaeota archaeon]